MLSRSILTLAPCILAGVTASCGSPVPMGACAPMSEMPPQVDTGCAPQQAFMQYAMEVSMEWSDKVRFSGSAPNESVWLTIVYAEGPVVESVCYGASSDAIETSSLRWAAKSAAKVDVPRALACFAGQRLDIVQSASPSTIVEH